MSLFLVLIIKNIIYYSLTCDGTDDKHCLTCNTSAHRYYHSHKGDEKCLCISGYLDDGIHEECTCHYSWFLLKKNRVTIVKHAMD